MPELWIPVYRTARYRKTGRWETRSNRMNQPKGMERNPCIGACGGYRWSPGRSLRAIGLVDQKLRTCVWGLRLEWKSNRLDFGRLYLSEYLELETVLATVCPEIGVDPF